MNDCSPFLASSEWIDVHHPLVQAQAQQLAASLPDPHDQVAIAQASFEFVRDQIAHTGDAGHGPITCRASDVLAQGTGFCYAKSHLLAALLRAHGIAAALCYQRLSVGEQGAPYCLHGLNAVWLSGHGWYRIDARGNKPGVQARFTPPVEVLAFEVRGPQEWDVPGWHAEPFANVVLALQTHTSVNALKAHLPDAPRAHQADNTATP
jgi:transglutaminase-like putative cysteine protease